MDTHETLEYAVYSNASNQPAPSNPQGWTWLSAGDPTAQPARWLVSQADSQGTDPTGQINYWVTFSNTLPDHYGHCGQNGENPLSPLECNTSGACGPQFADITDQSTPVFTLTQKFWAGAVPSSF